MPLPPSPRWKVIDGKSGYVVENKSWLLERLMRDVESWVDPEAIRLLQRVKEERTILEKMRVSPRNDPGQHEPRESALSSGRVGLCVSVYEPDLTLPAGRPTRDVLSLSAASVILIQFGVAAIPLGLHGSWSVILLTFAGTWLALLTAHLPEWRREKTAYRRNSNRTYSLVAPEQRHAIVILGNGGGINLQDLARNGVIQATSFTTLMMLILTTLWVGLLITATGVEYGSWYLMGVAALGTLYNWYAGNAPRRPSTYGIHLQLKDVIGRSKVMDTLYEVEARFPRVGKSMLQTFFPGRLRDVEVETWQKLDRLANTKDEDQRESLRAEWSSPGYSASALTALHQIRRKPSEEMGPSRQPDGVLKVGDEIGSGASRAGLGSSKRATLEV